MDIRDTGYSNVYRSEVVQGADVRAILNICITLLGILTVTSLYMLEVLCFMKKFSGSTSENSAIHEHNTRRKMDLHIQSCRKSLYKKSVINTGIKLFNQLPLELKQLQDFKQFRKKWKLLLLNKALYTLNEYFDVCIE
jgi:hypothetical protein